MLAQKRGVIRLLPTPNKKREHLLKLENWRPVSLLNVDYKIGSKTLAMRLEKFLPKIIHSDQAGFVTGRFIGECIRTMDDVLYFTDYRKQPGIALFLDFSKAFDSLEHPFIYNSLKAFNFGDFFIRWLKTFYSNANSCIINNGYTSEYFSIKRGVRQGDPLSGALLVIAVELLAKSLRSNKNIKGIPVDGASILINQYADDTTVFVEDVQSAEEVFRTFELFEEVSGLSLNKSKCEGRWLGTLKHCRLKPFNILWPEKPTRALGVHFSYNQEQTNRLNFDDKIEKLDKTLKAWSGRNLTPIGKICILKMFAISKLLYLCGNMNVPETFPKQVNSRMFDFIWNFSTPKVKRTTLIQTTRNGGLNMPDMTIICKSLKVLWLKRLLNDDPKQWKVIPIHFF